MALTERDLEDPDPLRLSGEIARAAGSLLRWRRGLRRGEGFDEDPFVAARLVAGRSAFLAVSGLREDDPLRVPLQRWVYRLAEQRIDRDALVSVARERYQVEHVTTEPERVRAPAATLLRRALGEPRRRNAWMTAFVGVSSRTASAVAMLWERRQEIAVRQGLGGPDPIELPLGIIVQAASDWLERTRDAFLECTPGSLGDLVEIALGSAATEGWPGHLSPQSILDLFRETDLLRAVDLDPGELPERLGPASFLRALARVFAAWDDALGPQDQPFVVARDPYGLRRRTTGALFGMLPASAPFARRALGLDTSRIAAHQRVLARALLVATRVAALRVVLRPAALAGRRAFGEAFQEGTARALGLALDPGVAGALPRLHADDAQRFSGLLLAATKNVALRSASDEDWYRNPRAAEQLRDEARLSPETTTDDVALRDGAAALYASIAPAL